MALAVAFVATELWPVHLHVGRSMHVIGLYDIPLVVGLVLAPGTHLVWTRLVAVAVAVLVVDRQPPVKAVINLGIAFAETAGVLWLAAVLAGDAASASPAGWLAAVVAALVGTIAASTPVSLAIMLTDGTAPRGAALRAMAGAGAVGLATTSFAVVIAVVVATDWRASFALLAVGTALGLALHGHATLRHRHRTLEHLVDFTERISGLLDQESVALVLLDGVRDLMRCDVAEVVLDDGADGTVRYRLAGGGGPSVERGTPLHDKAFAPARSLWRSPRRNPTRALTAVLRDGDDLVGTLYVAERLDDVSTFDRADTMLLAALANQAVVALRNGRMADQIRVDAAAREYEALHDPLTGLPNRTLLDHRVTRQLTSARRVAVALLDVDRLKDVNDTMGYATGDALLQQVAQRLRAIVPAGATTARLGGDEFVVLLPGADGEDGLLFAERAQRALRRPFTLDAIAVEVTARVGVAVAPDHGTDGSLLLRRADLALHEAKASGRPAAVYDPATDTTSPRQLTLVGDLRRTIEAGLLDVHYQPQADLATGRVTGVEALVRWHHPDLGSIRPDDFISVAERTGLIVPLTRFVLRTALERCRQWREAGLDLGVAVNLSPRSLLDSDLPDQVAAALADAAMPPASLTLEITESTMMVDQVRSGGTLAALGDLGVRLAVDDLGTGFSSLSQLKRLPVDEIKIDKSFILQMGTDADDEAIVGAIVEMGHRLGKVVVAEGVEDAETWRRLDALGCDVGQGFWLSRPLPAGEVAPWLSAWAQRASTLN